MPEQDEPERETLQQNPDFHSEQSPQYRGQPEGQAALLKQTDSSTLLKPRVIPPDSCGPLKVQHVSFLLLQTGSEPPSPASSQNSARPCGCRTPVPPVAQAPHSRAGGQSVVPRAPPASPTYRCTPRADTPKEHAPRPRTSAPLPNTQRSLHR